MDFFKKLKELFNGTLQPVESRVIRKIHAQCDWAAIEGDVFPKKGTGARLSVVLNAIIDARNFKLLTPLVAEAGDYMDLIDLVYRKGEYGPVPPTRLKDLEDIYTALKAAPRHGAKAAENFITTVESWACQRNSEECYDWARKKPEGGPVEPVGLVALADHAIVGNRLAMKVLHNADEIARAVDAVEWFYGDKWGDRDIALDNINAWRKKLEEINNTKKPPAPPAP